VSSAAVDDALADYVRAVALEPGTFPSTGSKGFRCQGQVTADGKRYQVSIQAVLIGSKQNPGMQVRASADQMKAALVDLIRAGVPEKTFTSGKTGFYTSGSLQVGSESYQSQVQAVLLASR
jgi:hypothetical protein